MSTRIRYLCCIHTVSQPALYGSICLFILLPHLTVALTVVFTVPFPSLSLSLKHTPTLSFPLNFTPLSSSNLPSTLLPAPSLSSLCKPHSLSATPAALVMLSISSPKHTILLHIHFFHVMHTHTHTDPIRQISFTNVCSTESTHSCTTHMPGCETAKQSHMHTHTVLLWTIVDTRGSMGTIQCVSQCRNEHTWRSMGWHVRREQVQGMPWDEITHSVTPYDTHTHTAAITQEASLHTTWLHMKCYHDRTPPWQ